MRDLEVGHFYWVKPEFDVDFTPPGFEAGEWSDDLFQASWVHWTQNDQPARFAGYGPDGEERWTFLGQDDPGEDERWWSVCWVGPEIVNSA